MAERTSAPPPIGLPQRIVLHVLSWGYAVETEGAVIRFVSQDEAVHFTLAIMRPELHAEMMAGNC